MEPKFPYEDIIHLSRPVSEKRARMGLVDRGAQFSPFAALTGFDAAIQETARLTDRRAELTEGEKLRLNEKIRAVLDCPGEPREICLTWFQADLRKSGGEYIRQRCRIRKPDPYGRGLILTDGRMIPYDDILSLEEVEAGLSF